MEVLSDWLQTNFIILPHFKISYPVALGIDESVVPWELMTKKKARKSHWEAHYGKLGFFLLKFFKKTIYWVLWNNVAKVKSLLCEVILQISLMKLFFIPFWMLPAFDVCKCRCRLWVLISLSFSFFYAYLQISHVLYTCNNNIPNTLSIKK